MDRTISVDNLESVRRAMELLPDYMEKDGPMKLEQVVRTKPLTEAMRRTPLATTRRYTNYVRMDGKRSRTNRTMSGVTGQLRRSIGTRVQGMNVQFGTVYMQDILYANRIHETNNPREGQYWTEGMRGFGRGWTTSGTGNKFIEKPVRNTSAYVIRTLSQKIDEDLARRGL